MMVLKASDVRELDKETIQGGISSKALMKQAALSLAERMREVMKEQGNRICIVCGPGNNGGDGFALAEILHQDEAIELTILCLCEEEQMSLDEAYYAKRCKEAGITWMTANDGILAKADMIVDCLFGTGLCREVHGAYAKLIQEINASSAYVLACDIPSGLHADEGICMNECVKADETITFAAGKLGLYIKEGIPHAGIVRIVDIGIPEQLLKQKHGYEILDAFVFSQCKPQRTAHSHKGSYGKALIIGGSFGMSGAVVLAARAALRCGLGTCTIMAEEKSLPIIASMLPEAMVMPLPAIADEAAIQAILKQYDTIAIGNGLGRTNYTKWLVKQAWESEVSCVFDGDALYLLGKLHEKAKRNAKTVLTPHPKEVSYLLGTGIGEVLESPSETLYRLENAYQGATIVMKDTRTMISDGQHRYINVIGNDGLATGGSGDTLCGMILGFLAQHASSIDASLCGVYLHAACADALLQKMSTYSILPSDLIEILPSVLKELIEKTA